MLDNNTVETTEQAGQMDATEQAGQMDATEQDSAPVETTEQAGQMDATEQDSAPVFDRPLLDVATSIFSLDNGKVAAVAAYFAKPHAAIKLATTGKLISGYVSIGTDWQLAKVDLSSAYHHCSCRGSVDNARAYPCVHGLALLAYVDNGGQIDPNAANVKPRKTGQNTTQSQTPQSQTQRLPRGAAFQQKLSKSIGAAIEQTAHTVVTMIQRGKLPFMLGPTGVGKTSTLEYVRAILSTWLGAEVGIEHHTGSETYSDADLVGLQMATKEILGVIGRAFERGRAGEYTLINLDEMLRNNNRIINLMLNGIQRRSSSFAVANKLENYDPSIGDVYIIEAPVFGRIWTPADKIFWSFGANPWGMKLDPAFIRRIDPLFVSYSLDVLKLVSQPIAEKIQAIWQLNAEGVVSLPIEYQLISQMRSADDDSIFADYLQKARLLDPTEFELIKMTLGVSD